MPCRHRAAEPWSTRSGSWSRPRWGAPRCGTVARSLGLTTRTLRCRLEAEEASYSSIVEDARTSPAERYLANERLSLTDISYQRGFAAPSACSRWFRDRCGISPTEWRREAAGSSADAVAGRSLLVADG
jgi:AraC-like DNA-binding protein